MPLSRNISSDKFLNDDNDIALPPISVSTLISVCLPTPPPKTPVPKTKLVMTPEEYQSLIYNLLNEPITFPPEYPIKEKIGKLGFMCPRNYALNHPSTPLLFGHTQNGCSVDCREDWTLEKIILMLERGPHVSDKYPKSTHQLHEETLEKYKNRYARVVGFGNIRHKLPKNQALPVSMIPQKSKA